MRRAKLIQREEREEARRLPKRLAAALQVNQARAQYGTQPVCRRHDCTPTGGVIRDN